MRKKSEFPKKPKEKIGTILDKDVAHYLREKSAKEGRAISDVIQEAVLHYNSAEADEIRAHEEAVNRLCSRPFNLTRQEIDEILEGDYYDQ
jgi:hypothetical protein